MFPQQFSMNTTPIENMLLSQDGWLGLNCLCLKLAPISRKSEPLVTAVAETVKPTLC